MIPLQNPRAARSAAIFCQRQAPSGASQSTQAVRGARRSGNNPARRRGAGLEEGTLTEKQAKPAPLLHGKREAARGGQIGCLPFLREFPDHRRNATGLQGFFHGPERVPRGGRPHHQQPRGSKPEEVAAQPVKRPRLESGEILLHPDHRTAARDKR